MRLVSPLGSRTVRFPLASWSISIASNKDLKFPAPKPCRDDNVRGGGDSRGGISSEGAGEEHPGELAGWVVVLDSLEVSKPQSL